MMEAALFKEKNEDQLPEQQSQQAQQQTKLINQRTQKEQELQQARREFVQAQFKKDSAWKDYYSAFENNNGVETARQGHKEAELEFYKVRTRVTTLRLEVEKFDRQIRQFQTSLSADIENVSQSQTNIKQLRTR